MRRSIAAISLGGSLQEKFYAVAAAGFDAVELSEAELAYSDMSPLETRQLLDDLGLTIVLFHSNLEVDGISSGAFPETLSRAEGKFGLMTELGATLLRIPASAGLRQEADEKTVVEQLVALADRARQHDIRIGYEAVATGSPGSSYLDAWRVVAAAAHPHLGLIVDSFEVLVNGDDPAALSTIPGDKIFMVQLADASNLAADPETLGRHYRCFPGLGVLDVVGFTEQVLASGYAGPISLEILGDAIRAAPIRSAALEGYRSLIFLEELLLRRGRRFSQSVFEKTQLPPMQQESIGFIEFAVDPRSQRELEGWLRRMGFRLAGKHRSKDVTLYRQGEALIVLNAGTDTFAHYYNHLHGTAVCAIGLRLSDPAAILTRADLYKYKRYDERVGPQEYMMPAVRAPDGSLIHLLDEQYDPATDFEMERPHDAPSAAILRFDHVVRAVPDSQFDAWVLFHRALLGLDADNPFDLPDPRGIVHSRALHDVQNRLRMPLSFSENSKTGVAKSLRRFGGAGINQIAFETGDLFATVAELREQGVPLLSIPANYYRELEKDRGVAQDLVERMQDSSVLYDGDSGGSRFFHVYTEFFNGRFFFEFVQRENGYDHYGECNAPVRMAAQAKYHQRNRSRNGR